MTGRAVLQGLAVIGGMIDAFQVDGVRRPAAVIPVPAVAMAFRAGGLTLTSALKIGPVTGRAIVDRLAEARGVHDAAYGQVVAEDRRSDGATPAGPDGILKVCTARGPEEPEGGGEDREEPCFRDRPMASSGAVSY